MGVRVCEHLRVFVYLFMYVSLYIYIYIYIKNKFRIA